LNIKSDKNRILILPEEKKQKNKERFLLTLSGIFLGCAFPPFPFPFTFLLFFGLIPYFFILEKRRSLSEINKATYLTAFVFNVITLYWVGSWQKATDPFLMIAGGVLLFFNPILFLIPSTLYYFFKKTFSAKYALYFFPLFWITYEYLYMLTDLSFPWLTLGNGLAKFTIFIQIADIVGALGISLIILYINIFLFKAFLNYKISHRLFTKNLLIAFTIFLIVFAYGIFRISSYKPTKNYIRVGLIQPNLDPWAKWQSGNLNDLTKEYLNLSYQTILQGAKLVVWPETAYPVFLLDGSYPSTVDSIYSFIRKNKVYLLTGMPDIRYYYKDEKIPPDAKTGNQGFFSYKMYNGILLLSPETYYVQRYGKMKLVPFGERVPFSNIFPFLDKWLSWSVGISGWNVGRDTVNFLLPASIANLSETRNQSKDSIKINALVCYESIFPYFVTNFIQRGANMIAIVTNDSWYGKSSGPYQHEDIAILRAVENRRSVIRAANGGISCIINPIGKIEVQSKLFTKTFITGNVELETAKTIFTKYPLIIPILASYFSLFILISFIFVKIIKKIKN
jgi:apolipoprotein N-acyltransferase